MGVPSAARFHAIGIDLAWGDNPTGLAHIVGPGPRDLRSEQDVGPAEWTLREVRTATRVDTILAWIQDRVPRDDPCWIAVDAPLHATNPPGTQRDADWNLSKDLRKHRMSLLPVDRTHAERGMQIKRALEAQGYAYVPPAADGGPRRGMFETFPTGAQLGLFDLQRAIRYKHGAVDEKRARMQTLLTRVALLDDQALPMAANGVLKDLVRTDPMSRAGRGLKELEDRIDAYLCALVAVLAWTAPARLRTEGTPQTGFVTIPHLPAV